MASLLPSDVAIPTPIADTITAMITEKSGFLASAASGADLDAGAQMGGNFYTRGRYNEDTTADEVIDGSASTPGNVGSHADISPILRRKRARGIVDGTEAAMGQMLSGGTPDQQVIDQAAAYWARRIDAAMVSCLTAWFDASGCLYSTHLHSVCESGKVIPLSFSALVDGSTKVGDNLSELAAMVTHSKTWGNILKAEAARCTYVPMGGVMVPFYDGKRVILSDNVPTSGSGSSKKYLTILLRPGALFLAVQKAMREIVEINATVPETRITQTLHFAVGGTGIKWNVTDTNPTNTTLATANKWAKATSVDKAIGIVAVESNAN